MRFASLFLMLFVMPAAFAQSEDSRQLLDACIDALDPDIIGLDDIEDGCPGLGAALERLGITALLPANQRDLLSRNGLINLRSLHDRYQRTPERGQIGVDSVQAELEALREPVQAERAASWYERLRRWLRDAIDKRQDQANPWLRRWLDEHSLSETVQRGLFYGVILLVVVLAVLIVVNEVRAARTGRRKSRAASATRSDSPMTVPASSNVESPGERASALLRTLVATLVKTGRLQGAQSLTHRELLTRARFDDSAQSESFRHVTQLAEREVFSGKEHTSADLEDAVRAGQSLNAQLSGAAT